MDDATIAVDDDYVREPCTKRISYLVTRKRRRPNNLSEQHILAVWLQLIYLDIPVEEYLAARLNLYYQIVVAELLHCLLDAGHQFESADGNYVKDEHATAVQMVISAVEKVLPGREIEQVVDAMVDANDNVEGHIELEAAHIGEVQGRSLG